MIETLFAVLLITNGSIIETVPTEGMADCLKTKRVAMQNLSLIHISEPTRPY